MTGKEQEQQTGADFNELQEALHNGDEINVDVDGAEINPDHYRHGAMETIDEMLVVFGPEAVALYCRMCAWKYRARAPYKGEFHVDNAKADWYLKKAEELTGVLNMVQQVRQQQPMM